MPIANNTAVSLDCNIVSSSFQIAAKAVEISPFSIKATTQENILKNTIVQVHVKFKENHTFSFKGCVYSCTKQSLQNFMTEIHYFPLSQKNFLLLTQFLIKQRAR
jgi:hypothetical protein